MRPSQRFLYTRYFWAIVAWQQCFLEHVWCSARLRNSYGSFSGGGGGGGVKMSARRPRRLMINADLYRLSSRAVRRSNIGVKCGNFGSLASRKKSHDFGGYAREFGHLISRGQIGNKDVKKANKTKMRILPQNLISIRKWAQKWVEMSTKMSMKMSTKMHMKMINNNDNLNDNLNENS